MKRIIAGVLAASGLVSFASVAAAHTAIPIGSVNIRSGPGVEYAILGVLPDGDSAEIIGRNGDWLKVRTRAGIVGFMADWVTREVYDDEIAYLQVNTDVLNVRSGPALEAGVIGQIRSGERYRLLEGLGDWYKILAGGIGTGWVSADFATKVPPATAPAPTPPPVAVPAPPALEGLVKDVRTVINTAMYNGRDRAYAQVATVRAGEPLTYLEAAEGWVKVANTAGAKGWINGPETVVWDREVAFRYQASYSLSEFAYQMEWLRVREVVPGGTGLLLRTGPSRESAVQRSLTEGTQMKLLQVPDSEYVQVMLPDGDTGWLSRYWIRPVTGVPTETVRLTVPSPGIVRLEVSGQTARSVISTTASTLKIGLPDLPGRQGALPVGMADVSHLAMGRDGLTFHYGHSFRYQVLEQSAGRTVMELRPVVERMESLSGADRQITRIHSVGHLKPEAWREGDTVVLDLPGAILGSAVRPPAGMSVLTEATGVTMRTATTRTFALKRGAGYFDFVTYNAGLTGKTIVVDPGHGGSEVGATSRTGLTESAVNLAISVRLKALLEAAGAKVVMTRAGDTRCASPEDLLKVPEADRLRFDLGCRAEVSNVSGADLFISVHSNASPNPLAKGTETYWTSDNLNAFQSKRLAGLVQQELIAALQRTDLGVKEERFYVIKYSDAPAVLAEIAFVSNTEEEALLKQDAFRQQAAAALFRAITRYFQ